LDAHTPITAQDVAQAERDVARHGTLWEHFNCRVVPPQEMNEADAHVAQGERELRARSSDQAMARLKYGAFWLLQYTRIATWGWHVGALISGTTAVALAAVPLVIAFNSPEPVFIRLALTFLLAGSITAVALFPLSGRNFSKDLDDLRLRLSACPKQIAVLGERLQRWKHRQTELRQTWAAQQGYENASRRHSQLVELLNSRRYQLIQSDWRSLRGIPFEDFVASIFEELGYAIEKTKASGDQGVDLIARGKGRTIAVQTKGYSGSVGNKAIQEVHAGMAFYRCQECVAITNSNFTSGARALAGAVRCGLVDCQTIPQLIDGKIF
jgi:Restriction endonuclease